MRITKIALVVAGIAVCAAIMSLTTADAQSTDADPLLLSPTSITFGSNATVPPNSSLLSRWNYTVPAGREFRVEAAWVQAITGTVPFSEALISVTTPDAKTINLVEASGNLNISTSFYNLAQYAGTTYFPSGTVIQDFVSNSSTSATIPSQTSLHGTEFQTP